MSAPGNLNHVRDWLRPGDRVITRYSRSTGEVVGYDGRYAARVKMDHGGTFIFDYADLSRL